MTLSTRRAAVRGRLLLLAVALPALLVSAMPGIAAAKDTKKPAAPACRAGEVVVAIKAKGRGATARRLVCRSLLPKGGTPLPAERAWAIARPSIAELRAGLPKRARARFPAAALTKLEAAMRRATTTAAASAVSTRARAAAAGDCAGPGTGGEPEEQTKDGGVKVRGSARRWGEFRTPTWGNATDVTVTLPNGSSQRKEDQDCTSWDVCPDADGNLAGRYVWARTESLHAEQDGMSVSMSIAMRVEAELTAHVGADGRLTTFDWVAEGTGRIRAQVRQGGKLVKQISAGNLRTVIRGQGSDPRDGGKMPGKPSVKAWGSWNGLLDGSNQPSMDIAQTLANMSLGVPSSVSYALLAAEKQFYDEGACLDVVFDPQRPEIQPGQQLAVTVKVKAKDGAEVPATYDATAIVGSVAAEHASTPGPTTWTAPTELAPGWQPTFKVVAVSKRGRAVGTHTAHAGEQTWWRVTFEGSGTYHRYEPRGIPYPQLWADHEFSWKTTYEPIRLPAFDELPDQPGRWGSTSVTLTGTLNAKRVDGGGTHTCSAAPDTDPQRVIGWIEARRKGDDFIVSPTAFLLLAPPFDTPCSTFSDMLLWTQGTADAMTADVTVGWAQRGNDGVVTFDVTPSRTLQACAGGESNGDFSCTHSVDWKGTVRMEKVAAPAGQS